MKEIKMEKCKSCKYYDEWVDYIDIAEDFSNIQYCCMFYKDERCRRNCKHYKNKYKNEK